MSPPKSIIVLAFVALLFTSLVIATPSINNPIAGTTWTAGQTVTITWINDGPGPTKVTLVLRKGDPKALSDIATIATDVPVEKLSVSYQVPSTLVTGNDYTVGIGESPDFAYSHQFTINGASGPVSSISSSGSPSSSLAPSASGSASASLPHITQSASVSPVATKAPISSATTSKTTSPSAQTPSTNSNSTPAAPSTASRFEFGYIVLGLVALLPGLFLL